MASRTLHLIMTALNGALYLGIGLLTYAGIFAPIVGVVRFWGFAVVVPAVFAALFGPFVGGLGASIGIFFSDIYVHGNALLSISVGVPANYVMFHTIGWISNQKISSRIMNLILGFGSMLVVLVFTARYFYSAEVDLLTTLIFTIFCGSSILLLILVNRLWPKWRKYAIASVIGNFLGSLIVGLGVWIFSQFFLLPMDNGFQLPLSAAAIWFAWTFSNQMPFLLILGPPILNACYKAFPSLTKSSHPE